MEENRELRERIEVLEQFSVNGQKEELKKSLTSLKQTEKPNALDEIMKIRKEKYFLEKKIRELEEHNLYLTAGSGGFFHPAENEKVRNGVFTAQGRRESPNGIMNSTFTSLRSAGGQRFTPSSQINVVEETENHFRTTTNFARNTMYRSGIKAPELRPTHSSAEPSRDLNNIEDPYFIDMPPRTANQKRDFYGLAPIPEQKSINHTLQTTQVDNTESLIVEKKVQQLPPQSKSSSRGSKRSTRPKSQNKGDVFMLNDIYMPKITPTNGKSQLTSREEKLMKLMQDRRVAPKVKGSHNNSFF